MTLFHSFLLGLVQGVTEFLPVSSSGHLVLAGALMSKSFNLKLMFEVVTNFGTLCSILVYYHSWIADIIRSWIQIPRSSKTIMEQYKTDPNLRLTWYVFLSMIPAGVIGVLFQDQIQQYMLKPVPVCFMLLITGTILFLTRFRHSFPNHMESKSAVLVGIAQACAILPGISRLGSTFSTGIFMGINREEMVNFSFLMVIPVSIGALLLEVKDALSAGGTEVANLPLIIGFFTAFIVGYFALKYFIILIKNKGIYPFAWYCWAVGIAGLIYFW
jgi:undecaprenyl-diphosphatase